MFDTQRMDAQGTGPSTPSQPGFLDHLVVPVRHPPWIYAVAFLTWFIPHQIVSQFMSNPGLHLNAYLVFDAFKFLLFPTMAYLVFANLARHRSPCRLTVDSVRDDISPLRGFWITVLCIVVTCVLAFQVLRIAIFFGGDVDPTFNGEVNPLPHSPFYRGLLEYGAWLALYYGLTAGVIESIFYLHVLRRAINFSNINLSRWSWVPYLVVACAAFHYMHLWKYVDAGPYGQPGWDFVLFQLGFSAYYLWRRNMFAVILFHAWYDFILFWLNLIFLRELPT